MKTFLEYLGEIIDEKEMEKRMKVQDCIRYKIVWKDSDVLNWAQTKCSFSENMCGGVRCLFDVSSIFACPG